MKPLADHGTTARAKGRPAAGIKGCPCRLCRNAENAYDKRRRYLNETGRTRMVDAAPVQAHLQDLFADHAGWVQLAAATGVSSSTIGAILHGKRREITRRVATLLLAVSAADVQPPNRSTPALGSIRRGRALIALGHRFKDIAETSPLDLATVRYVINGNPVTISARTANGMNIAYRALAGRPGTSERSLRRARRDGWASPAAWDDDAIDDPTAKPNLGDRELSFLERAALRREEIIHFAWHGYEPEQILNRLNHEVSISTVRAVIYEWRTGQKRQRSAPKQVAA